MDTYDYLDALDGISPDDLTDTPPPSPPEDSIIQMLRDNEIKESIFVHLRK
jgi:hypothetical protein